MALALPTCAMAADAPPTNFSAGLGLCGDTAQPFPFAPTFIAWGRTGTVPMTGYTAYQSPSLLWYELWDGGTLDYSQTVNLDDLDSTADFLFTPDHGVTSGTDTVRWQTSNDTSHKDYTTPYPYKDVPACYREGTLTVPSGKGRVPKFKAVTKSTSAVLLTPDPGEVRVTATTRDCRPVQYGRGFFEVRRGSAKWRKVALTDLCSLEPVSKKKVNLGKGLTLTFKPQDTLDASWMPVVSAGLRGPSREVVTVRVRGIGAPFVKRVSVSRNDRPDRTIYEGTDDYWNVCIMGDDESHSKIYSENGRLYCLEWGTDSIVVK